MGLLNRQSDVVKKIIEDRWIKLVDEETKKESGELLKISRKWDADPRVITFSGTWENGLGTDWEQPMPATSPYRAAWPAYAHDQRSQVFKSLIDNWSNYEKGFSHGLLYDALATAGYKGPASDNEVRFYSNPQAAMLEVALHTTRKKWDTSRACWRHSVSVSPSHRVGAKSSRQFRS